MRFSASTLAVALGFIFLGVVLPGAAAAQEAFTGTLDVFVDCGRRCDSDYIRRQIPYVNYVRDREDAHVHVLITDQQTGSGGRNYQLNFIGQEEFVALRDTLQFASSNTDTQDETRRGLTRVIAAGLTRYLARTPIAAQLQISAEQSEEGNQPIGEPTPVVDPWNSWVFNIGTEGEIEGEESQDALSAQTRLSIARVTEEWKIRISLRGNYSRENYDLSDRTVTSTREDGSVWTFVARSVNDHWSVGASARTQTSTQNNTKLSSEIGPAIEYNIFPYSQSSERQVRIQYDVSLGHVKYEDLTIFDKREDDLLQQTLEVRLDFRQPWGSANARSIVKQYLTDFSESKTDFYSIELGGSINVRLVRGLSVSVSGKYEIVHDQLYLLKEEATEEEILLGTKKLPTAFEYNLSVGLNYSFGSIYNNIVNPRFGF